MFNAAFDSGKLPQQLFAALEDTAHIGQAEATAST
jgi:hypothetical protein